MKVFFWIVMKRKMKEENKGKIEARFVERKQKMNSFKTKLIIWNKYRWNIEKWILGKLISLTF